jgi:outer membrane protein assembly factor BamB
MNRFASIAAVVLVVSLPAAPSATAPVNRSLHITKMWSYVVPDGYPISTSSPNLATLDGQPAVLVGTIGGHVYALSLATRRPVPGWPASTAGIPVRSTPSVAALEPGSRNDTVFIGAGNPTKYDPTGAYEAFNPDGGRAWKVTVHDPGKTVPTGVAASLAVGDLQGSTDVVAPSMGQEEAAVNAVSGKMLSGFPWFTSDSGFSTPALADLYGNGKTEIIEGGAQTVGLAYGVQYSNGGHIRVLAPTGNAGTGKPSGGLVCTHNTDQEVDSSPAVGPFLAGRAIGIAVGTGTNWHGASDTDRVLALTTHCKLAWSDKLDAATTSSPALVDLFGTRRLDVVEGTANKHSRSGTVYALNGVSGRVLWQVPAPGEVMGGAVAAKLWDGQMDVVVVGTGGAEVLDGRNGKLIATLGRFIGYQNSALITHDPNGSVGITIAGYDAHNVGVVTHFEVQGPDGALVGAAGSWPEFHRDPQLNGWARAA